MKCNCYHWLKYKEKFNLLCNLNNFDNHFNQTIINIISIEQLNIIFQHIYYRLLKMMKCILCKSKDQYIQYSYQLDIVIYIDYYISYSYLDKIIYCYYYHMKQPMDVYPNMMVIIIIKSNYFEVTNNPICIPSILICPKDHNLHIRYY